MFCAQGAGVHEPRRPLGSLHRQMSVLTRICPWLSIVKLHLGLPGQHGCLEISLPRWHGYIEVSLTGRHGCMCCGLLGQHECFTTHQHECFTTHPALAARTRARMQQSASAIAQAGRPSTHAQPMQYPAPACAQHRWPCRQAMRDAWGGDWIGSRAAWKSKPPCLAGERLSLLSHDLPARCCTCTQAAEDNHRLRAELAASKRLMTERIRGF